jgi:hypothetical protein
MMNDEAQDFPKTLELSKPNPTPPALQERTTRLILLEYAAGS